MGVKILDVLYDVEKKSLCGDHVRTKPSVVFAWNSAHFKKKKEGKKVEQAWILW